MTKEELIKSNEKKKEYLKSYIPMVKRAKLLQEEINQLKLAKMYPSVVNDGMPHGSSLGDLSSYIAELDKLERFLIEAKRDCFNKYTEILSKIELLEDATERNLLLLKYIRGMKWEEICVELAYEWTWVHKLHRDALIHFQL